MIRGLLLLGIGVLSWLPSEAQYVPEDTAKVPVHQFGAYLSSPLMLVMGGVDDNPRMGIQYKFGKKDYANWRIAFVLDGSDVNDEDEFLSTITHITDTTISYFYSNDYATTYSLRFGKEWTNKARKVAPVYAVDFIAGVTNQFAEYSTIQFGIVDTLGGLFPDLSRELSRTGIEDYTQQKYFLGASLTIGYRVEINRRLNLMMSLSPEFTISPFQTYTNRLQNGKVYDGMVEARARLRLFEVQLFVQF